jgi:Flp pilus assembly protein TadG
MRGRGGRGRCAPAERGQGTVEFALLLPVLLLLVVGVINFAFILHTYIQVVSAAGVGATYGATNAVTANDIAGMSAAALADSANWHCNAPTATRSSLVGDPYGFQRVSVTVTCQVTELIIGPGGLGPVTVSATATRRVRK